ncbi:MAG: T9SS type A sorting domain-containing protein [Ignavibacteria bacterium]|nr:T9SS type A sorting domain-containing protein [Ignavibacteria bacterium]
MSAQCLIPMFVHNPAKGIYNSDSVLVDTCGGGRVLYARKSFEIRFILSPLRNDATPSETGYYDIDDFDTTQADFAEWFEVGTMYEPFLAKWVFDSTYDSVGLAFRTYRFEFDDYVPVDTIVDKIRTFSNIEYAQYINRAMKQLSIPNDPGLKPLTTNAEYASPATSTGEKHKRTYLLGWQRAWYDLHVPLAWEITKGSATIYAGVDDYYGALYTGQPQLHQDLTLHTSTPAGNYFYPGQQYGGSLNIQPLADNTHGYPNLHIMAAQENSLGLIGIAPLMRVFATQKGRSYTNLDLSANIGNQLPHIMTCAYYGENKKQGDNYQLAMQEGIVVISAIDNDLGETKAPPCPYTDCPLYDKHNETRVENENTIVESVSVIMLTPKTSSPGGSVYYDPDYPSDPTKDLKVLCVASYDQEFVPLTSCEMAFRGAPMQGNFSPISYGVDKFNNNTDPSIRIGPKSYATIDVVTPINRIGAKYGNGSSFYADFESGNSRSVPQVGGIVGLMMAVHERLGRTGYDVHRRVYDIVTFTADKILDQGLSNTVAQTMAANTDPNPYSRRAKLGDETLPVREYGIPNQGFVDWYSGLLTTDKTKLNKDYTDYMAMANDVLSRYWTIRFGFGRINAFRCVAHSIPGKNSNNDPNVQYQYSGSDVLRWDRGHSLDGKTYLHLGKFKDATNEVLAVGGVAYPGEPAYMNNNGKTLVDVNLSVGANQALVIDGILTSTGTDKKISTSHNTARILATGWVKDVLLEGQVRASDLRVIRTSNGTALKTVGISELHDTTWLRGGSELVVESGTLTLMPGATIFLTENAKITVKKGARLIMMHASRIVDKRTTKLANCITLENKGTTGDGGILEVNANSEEVVIDAELLVGNGAILKTKAVEGEIFPNLSVHKVIVEDGGSIDIVDKTFIQRINPASTTPGIVVKSATGIIVPTSATVRIDVPIEIQSGGKVEVGISATLKTGSLLVQSNGTILANLGSTIQLLDEKNFVHGKFIAEGAVGSPIKVKSTIEVNTTCSGLNRVIFSRLDVTPDKWIYNTNTPGSVPLDQNFNAYFLAQYVEFSNVFTTITNMPIFSKEGGFLIGGKLRDCKFTTDRTKYTESSLNAKYRNAKLFLLHVTKDSREFQKARLTGSSVPSSVWWQGRELVTGLLVENCQFSDAGGKITKSNYRNLTQLVDDYPVSGLHVDNMSPITLQNSELAFLHVGAALEYGRIIVSGNIFGGHADGLSCDAGRICGNVFSGCTNGVRSSGSAVYDNTFGGTMGQTINPLFGSSESVAFIGSGYFQGLASTSNCRNNHLENYTAGFDIKVGKLEAGDQFGFLTHDPNDRGNAIVHGRNNFAGKTATGANPYPSSDQAADMYINEKGSVEIKCGRNVFSANQTYQLQKAVTPTELDVTTNNFGTSTLLGIRRNTLITPVGSDLLNGEHPVGASCASSNRLMGEVECVQLPVPEEGVGFPVDYDLQGLSYLNIKLFGIEPPDSDPQDSNYIKEVYNVSRYWLLNDTVDVASRVSAIGNAVRAVLVHPQLDSVNQELSLDLQSVLVDTSQQNEIRQASLLGLVKLLSYSEQFGEALFWLDSMRIGLFSGYDSVTISHLSAKLSFKADTTLTVFEKTDSLNAVVALEVEHAKRPETMAKQAFPKLETGGQHEHNFTVYPNPNNGKFVAKVESSKTEPWEIRVLDLFGVELLRITDIGSLRSKEIELNIPNAQNGILIVQLVVGKNSVSRMISIVR